MLHMYTGTVVKFRTTALALACLIAVTPVLATVCRMGCDEPRAVATCHESTSLPGGLTLRGAPHACDHEHSSGPPALLTSASTHASLGRLTPVAVGAPA